MSSLSAIRAGREFRRDPLAFLRSLEEPSDVLRFRVGMTDFTLLRHPDAVRIVLVTEEHRFGEGKWTHRGERVLGDCLITREGEPHRRRRQLLDPGFEAEHLRGAAAVIGRRAAALSGRWQDGQQVEMRTQMGLLALGVALETLFDVAIEDLDEQGEELLRALWLYVREIPLLPRPGRGLGRARRIVERVAADVRGGHLVAEMRRAGAGEPSIRREIVATLVASVDTTPGTMAWIWTQLAREPDVATGLRAELTTVLGDRDPEEDDLGRLPVLKAIVKEVLRLYPPVHFVDRRTLEDVEFGKERVAAESYLLLSPLLTQRDERFFEDPDSFRPSRWEKGQGYGFAYFPFGAGSHGCIGGRLAQQQLVLSTAALAREWRPHLNPGFPDPPSPQTSQFPMWLERLV